MFESDEYIGYHLKMILQHWYMAVSLGEMPVSVEVFTLKTMQWDKFVFDLGMIDSWRKYFGSKADSDIFEIR
ncbi:hypothetical protein FRX31_006977 [Thalictrum thalictroides]|uniref:Uncharacterized protein n=1 Tax=Thalictrum thalictroides TaxID=46969 RepID=A0A7J6X2Y9_THATH|nr:hypothetical protein FRX31_006977 [Thalictrum thalictroides]